MLAPSASPDQLDRAQLATSNLVDEGQRGQTFKHSQADLSIIYARIAHSSAVSSPIEVQSWNFAWNITHESHAQSPPRDYNMAAGPWVYKGQPSPGWWSYFIFSFSLSVSGRVISWCDLRSLTSDLTEGTMDYHENAIIISDDEEERGLEQGRSQPPRASRPDYSYRLWEDAMDVAAASDDATDDATDDAITFPARKRKRIMTDRESITSILV